MSGVVIGRSGTVPNSLWDQSLAAAGAPRQASEGLFHTAQPVAVRFTWPQRPHYGDAMGAIAKETSAFFETLIDDELVIVSRDSGKFFSLKDTGLAIWNRIDGGKDREALLQELAESFDAPDDVLAEDLDEFLVQLSNAGFINLR